MLKIPPDYTFVVEIVIFVVLWLALKRWWFEPAMRIARERARRSEGAVAEARAIQAEAEQLRAQHAAALDQARSEAQREVQELIRTAEAEQKAMLAAAQDDAHRTINEVRARVAEEVTRARAELRDQARDIARDVARAILGRPA
jgi:F-type H+-transporting ATPase subunit b